jgi:hypothetical protein
MSKLGGLLALSALVALSLCGSQRAQAQQAATVSDDELAALFAAFCLDAFPVAASLDRAAASKKAVAMKPDELKAILHDDPGRGWMLRTSEALYAVTVEFPPYNACAVRRMTPVGVSGVKNYLAAVNKYVAAKNGKLANLPPQKSTLNGVDISLYGQGMTNGSGQPQETFAVVLSNYHGRAGGIWRADAGTGVGVEVRFVHQFVKQ